MRTQNYIKVEPQPRGSDYLWPGDNSHIEWHDVEIEPDYYFESWQVVHLEPDDEVTVAYEDSVWYWVITPRRENE